MECVKLGIIGIGTMGSVHAQSIMEGKIARCKPTVVCDPKREPLKRFSSAPFSFQSKICCARLRRMQS
jgi:predicted dehydrogenase